MKYIAFVVENLDWKPKKVRFQDKELLLGSYYSVDSINPRTSFRNGLDTQTDFLKI